MMISKRLHKTIIATVFSLLAFGSSIVADPIEFWAMAIP
jgi:hypothetical protein